MRISLSWSYIPPVSLADWSVAKTFDAKDDAPNSFLHASGRERTQRNHLPVKRNLVQEPVWPGAGGAPGSQHTCPALIEIKWMSDGWAALTELWNSGEVKSHAHTSHVCASGSERVWCGLLSIHSSEWHTSTVLINPNVLLKQNSSVILPAAISLHWQGFPSLAQLPQHPETARQT